MAASESAARQRKDPVGTRRAVLEAAYEEIHRHGFQAASLARIIDATGLTKGALYHHFPSKQALGYAVFDELVAPLLEQRWLLPLAQAGSNPIDALIAAIQEAGRELTDADLALGCPLNNLAQEMSPVDEGFRMRISTVFDSWRDTIAAALARGKAEGSVRADLDESSAAAFLVAALEGCAGMAKNARSRTVLEACGAGLLTYLDSLRAR